MSETGIFEELIHTMNLPEKIVKIARELLEQKDALLMRSIRVRVGLAIVQAIERSGLPVEEGWRSYKIAQYLHIAKSSLYNPFTGKRKIPNRFLNRIYIFQFTNKRSHKSQHYLIFSVIYNIKKGKRDSGGIFGVLSQFLKYFAPFVITRGDANYTE